MIPAKAKRPLKGTPTLVHHRQDANLPRAERLEKAVGKSTDRLRADGSADNRRRCGLLKQSGECHIDCIEESDPKRGRLQAVS